MPTSTAELNKEPHRCDAYHEAGHAVIGVILKLKLSSVTCVDHGETHPHCVWDFSEINGLLKERDDQEALKKIDEFSQHHAMMCLASGYAEKLACDTSSDEQAEALHCDYLDAERIHYHCVETYLGKTLLQQLRVATEGLVQRNKAAIEQVAEELLKKHTLDQEQILSLITGSSGV